MNFGNGLQPTFWSFTQNSTLEASKSDENVHAYAAHSPQNLYFPESIIKECNKQSEEHLGRSLLSKASVPAVSTEAHLILHEKNENSRKPSELNSKRKIDFKKRPGAGNMKGDLYKVHLTMLFQLQGLIKIKEEKVGGFHLATNMFDAGDFRDIVFKYEYKDPTGKQLQTENSEVIFLCSRHVDDIDEKLMSGVNETGKKAMSVVGETGKNTMSVVDEKDKKSTMKQIKKRSRMSVAGLLSDARLLENEKTFDVNLENLFTSYLKIKRQFSTKRNHPIFRYNYEEIKKNFIYFTNASFSSRVNEEIFKEIATDPESILYFGDKSNRRHCYELIFDTDKEKVDGDKEMRINMDEKIENILQYSSDCKRMATVLVEYCFRRTERNIVKLVNSDVLKRYSIPLEENVFKVSENKIKFRDSFLNGCEELSDSDKVFRKVFFEEAIKICKKSENEVKQELQNEYDEFPNTFEINSKPGEGTEFMSLPDDLVEKSEMKDFLSNFTFFIGQSNENQLSEMIKDKLKSYFSVDERDVDCIFSDIKCKIESWLKDGNSYLTEDNNRFFQDSMRICISFNVRKPVLKFTGRKEKLNELHCILQANDEKDVLVPKVAYIIGLGGIGKTELARKYVEDHNKDYDNNIIWINAESDVTLANSFRTLAKDKLGLEMKGVDQKEKDIESIVADVYKYLRKRKTLFIFDNAEKLPSETIEKARIRKFLPAASSESKIFCLITSRIQNWEHPKKILQLDAFNVDEAKEFIRCSLQIEKGSQEDELHDLSETLQRFPLALEQAVAFIKQQNEKLEDKQQTFSIIDYLKEYKKNEGIQVKEILDLPLEGSDVYSKTTFRTWNISLQKIKDMDYGDEAIEILNVIAYFSADNISTGIFLTKFSDKEVLSSALHLLKGYSMIGLEQGVANIHRLVQGVTRLILKRDCKEIDVLIDALTLLEKCMIEKAMDSSSSKYTFHAVSAWNYAGLYHKLVQTFSYVPLWTLNELEKGVKYEEAYLFAQKASVTLEKVLGPNHVNTILTTHAIGVTLNQTGKYEEAFHFYETVLHNALQVFAPDHACILLIEHNMAGSLRNLGKYCEALEIYDRVLEKRKRISGVDNFDTLTTMSDRAMVLTADGKYDDALDSYQYVLDRRIEKLGPSHPDTLRTEHGIAFLYDKKGRYDAALKINREVLKKREEILGSHHPETLMTRNNVALNLHRKRMFSEALTEYQKLLEHRKKVSGPNHPQTLITEHSIATVFHDEGKYQEALRSYQDVLRKRKHFLSDDHPDTVLTMRNIASVLFNQEKFEEALTVYEEVLNKRKGIFGDNHICTLETLGEIADVLTEQGRYDKALCIYQEVLLRNLQSPNISDQPTLSAENNTNQVLYKVGHLDEALTSYQDVLDLLENSKNILDSDNTLVLRTMEGIAAVLCAQQKYDPALQLFQYLLKKRKEYLDEDHPDTLETRISIASIKSSQGNYDEALLICDKILITGEKIWASNHLNILKTLFIKGITMHGKKCYESALNFYEIVLQRRKQLLGSQSEDSFSLKVKHYIGLLFRDQGEYDTALIRYQEVLKIRKHILSPTHSDTLKVMINIADVYVKQSLYTEALKTYREVLDECEQILKPCHFLILSAKSGVSKVLHLQGFYDQALSTYQEVAATKEKILGFGDLSTLETLNNIAIVLHDSGHFNGALETYSKVLKELKKDLEPCHSSILTTQLNIVRVQEDMGCYDRALKACQELLNEKTFILDPDHPDILSIESYKASVLHKKGKYAEALEIYLGIIPKKEKSLGPDDPNTLRTKNEMGKVLFSLERYEDALGTFEEVMNKKREKLDTYHPEILHSKNQRAHVLFKLGNYEKAAKEYRDVLVKRQHILGPFNPCTLLSHINVAEVLQKQGNHVEALEICHNVLDKIQNVTSQYDPDTLFVLDTIAMILSEQEYHEESLKVYKEALDNRIQILDSDHPDILMTKYNMAATLFQVGNYNEALKTYIEVLNKRRENMGSYHPDTLAAESNVAAVMHKQNNFVEAQHIYREIFKKMKHLTYSDRTNSFLGFLVESLNSQGDFDLALQACEEILSRRVKVLCPDHRDILATKHDLAGIHFNKGNYDEALRLFREVLDKRKSTLEPDDLSVLETKNCIGLTLHKKGCYEEALGTYRDVLERKEKVLRPDDPDILSTMEYLATLCFEMGKYQEALEMHQDALYKKELIFGPDHPDTLTAMNHVATVLYQQENYSDALAAYKAVLEKKVRLFPNKPDILDTMTMIACILLNHLENYVDAMYAFQVLWEKCKEVLGPYHNNTLSAENQFLHLVARIGKLDFLVQLLKKGDVILIRNDCCTLLHQAVCNDSKEVIEFILAEIRKGGLDFASCINAHDEDGDTPLMCAAEVGNVGALQILLECGANVNAKNKSGETALHWAVKGSFAEVAQLLLDNMANPDFKDSNGKTPLDLVYERLDDETGEKSNLKIIEASILNISKRVRSVSLL